jgi:hypothetical protein
MNHSFTSPLDNLIDERTELDQRFLALFLRSQIHGLTCPRLCSRSDSIYQPNNEHRRLADDWHQWQLDSNRFVQRVIDTIRQQVYQP